MHDIFIYYIAKISGCIEKNIPGNISNIINRQTILNNL